MPVLNRLLRYGLVGGTAAAHIGVLLLLGPWMSLSLANPIAFLAASVAGYLGHALLTFREETGGRQFARRWLLLQYVVNLSVCALLPLLKAPTLVLVFTPTLLNALIWSRAARFSAKARQHQNGQPPLLHADDLGLAEGVDAAILDLAQSGRLQGASLLVNGPSATAAVEAWRDLADPPPLTLHAVSPRGIACPTARIFRPDSDACCWLPSCPGSADASPHSCARFCCSRSAATASSRDCGRSASMATSTSTSCPWCWMPCWIWPVPNRITWVRTTREPLPEGLSLRLWWRSLQSAQVAGSAAAERAGHPAPAPGRTSNQPALRRSAVQWINVRNSLSPLLGNGLQLNHSRRASQPVVLIHPALPNAASGMDQAAFSSLWPFFSSPTAKRSGLQRNNSEP